MWQNYLKTVVRGMWRYKAYSAINVLGLVSGITCFLLIMLYVQYELSFDRYHNKTDRIFRVSLHASLAGNDIDSVTSPYPMAAALLREYPEIEATVRIRQFYRDTLVSLESNRYLEKQIFHADQSLFAIFDFEFLAGDPTTALAETNSIVITESTARKYFGEGSALGHSLTFNDTRDYLVTGVVRDVPANSHFHPAILVSFTSDSEHDSPVWISNNIQTYLLARPDTDIAALTEKLDELVLKYVAPQIEQALGINVVEFFSTGGAYGYDLQPLPWIHLNSHFEGEIEQNGNADYVYTFLAVALFILLLACVNYMNLSTARSANRAREIGLRKVLGARRRQLTAQFLCESVVVTCIAVLISIPLVLALLPAFGALTERTLDSTLLLNWQALTALSVFTVLVGVIAGSYPALYLANFRPQSMLKGHISKGMKSSWLRAILVVFQFTISIALVSATFIVFAQLDYMQSKPLGFDKEHVLVIRRANALGESKDAFLQQLKGLPGVINASASMHVPGEQTGQNVYLLEGTPASATKALWQFEIGYDYIETLGFTLLDGRSFSREFGEDETAYVINERAALELGIDNPTNHRIVVPDPDGAETGAIIGMVQDFHFESLHLPIRPLVFQYSDAVRYVVVRIEPANILQTIATIENQWRLTTNAEPFNYSFLDVDLDNLHRGDQRLGIVFTMFAALAILIACLGLYGLSSYTTEQRTREVGIRKTLGASLLDIVLLLTRDFMQLVGWAIVIAIPLAYLAMNWWLQLFSYRIDMPLAGYVYSSVIAVLIAFITVSQQAIHTGLRNPSQSLRHE